MRALLIVGMLALALTACSKPEAGFKLPTYACTTQPTGEVEIRQEQVGCGRGCSRNEPYTVHAVKITCDYKQWRRE